MPAAADFTLADVRAWVERSKSGRVDTRIGVISIENPVRRMDHQLFDPVELQAICGYAREQGIRLHLDGARLFTLPQHSGQGVRAHAAPFDTVYVSLYKHFNAAGGAILAGDSSTIQGLYHKRRMFGGSLPQAWPGLGPVPQYLASFARDYALAWQSAEELIARLGTDSRFRVERVPRGTSRFLLEVRSVPARTFAERLARHGITLHDPKADTAVIPMQVNPGILRMTPAMLMQRFGEAAKA